MFDLFLCDDEGHVHMTHSLLWRSTKHFSSVELDQGLWGDCDQPESESVNMQKHAEGPTHASELL